MKIHTMKMFKLICIIAPSLFCQLVFASTCGVKQDYTYFVSSKDHCLVMRAYGSQSPRIMLVWLHGDVSSGGPANYHFTVAKKAADSTNLNDVLSVALLRPGYADGEGRQSSAGFFQKPARKGDDYQRWVISEVASAVENLKDHFKPEKIILIGHSGGAAIAANILGIMPKLVSGAVLVACPCDLLSLRREQGWSTSISSENPLNHASNVDRNSIVILLTGEKDVLTLPKYAQSYANELVKNGVTAKFSLIKDATHNNAFSWDYIYPELSIFK
jgi:pimeloyl-ACP methyl ester carboxylesterase